MNTDALKALGRAIAKARIKEGLTQEQLALAIDMSPRVVQYYEAGTTNPPNETLFKIAIATNTHPSDLIAPMWDAWVEMNQNQ